MNKINHLSALLPVMILACLCYTSNSWADAVYCTNPGGYIQVGMTKSDIEEKCGKPFDVEKKRTFNMRKILVEQLFFRVAKITGGRGNTTFPADDGTGARLVVSIRANKVTDISLANTSTQSVTICKNGSFSVGDNVSAVTGACGKPIYINKSYVKVADSDSKPIDVETWLIRLNQNYGKTLALTFKNGILTDIQ